MPGQFTKVLDQAMRLHQSGRPRRAEHLCREILAAQPDHADALHLLGVLAHQAGRPGMAVELIERAIARQPATLAFHYNLAHMLRELGRPEAAAAHFAAALSIDPDDLTLRYGLVQALRRSSPDEHRPDLAQALERCFAWPDVNHQHLSALAAAQIKYKYGISGTAVTALDPGNPDFDRDLLLTLFSDGLFAALLTKTINPDGELELCLTTLRRALLLGDTGLSAEAEWRIMSCIAQQAFNNSYAFWVEEDEEACLAALKAALEAGSAAGNFGALLRFAMYATPGGLSHAGELHALPLDAWPEPLRPLIEKTLVDGFEEEAIKARIPTLGAIEDEASRAVRLQYEENPFPRWLAVNRPSRVDFAEDLHHRLPQFQPPAFLAEPLEVLVAGCGTGLQPISLALSYRDLRVVAVDLSKSSLAYAVRMAGRLKLDNIEFLQGDILELSALDRQFPVIECSGVLHHMAQPDRGLEVLRALLRPGGVIKIGLYSKLARKNLDALRAGFGHSGGAPTAAKIRAFRRRVLTSPDAAAFGNITRSPDFNNLSGCRDLLFHTLERRYSLPELKRMIERQSLRFLGFDLNNPATRRRYRTRFPDDPAMTSFASWQSFEAEFPDSFANMYRFWCQRPSA